jgi:outer membrane immunogenic protein
MIRILIGGTAFAVLVAANVASAADLVAATPVNADNGLFNWVGLHLGINGGGAWGRSRQDQLAAPNLSTGDFTVSGGMVGGTMGFDMQVEHIVFGLEGDLDWASISGSVACPTAGFTCATANDYLGTIRGRAGYAFYNVMPYLTAGGAIGDIRQSFSPAFGGNSGIQSNRIGWTAGGGVEYAFWYNWSTKLEYLHVDLGIFSCGLVCSGVAGQTINTPLKEDIFRAGLNYRF